MRFCGLRRDMCRSLYWGYGIPSRPDLIDMAMLGDWTVAAFYAAADWCLAADFDYRADARAVGTLALWFE